VTIATIQEHQLLDVHRGDADAVRQFVLDYQDSACGYARQLLNDRRDAEEVAADALVRAIRALRRYSDEQVQTLLVRPWLLRIVRNLASNRRRANARHDQALIPGSDDVLPSIADGRAQIEAPVEVGPLERAMQALKPSERELVALRFIEDLSYAEIAVITGGTESSARGKVFRALASLRRNMEDARDDEL
jgi:RNA polymerase sigma factor (sigma-70 family)